MMETARKIIFAQNASPAVKRSAWFLFRHELAKVGVNDNPGRTLAAVLRWMTEQRLTPHEKRVLRLLVAGKARKQIALEMGCRQRTVTFHLERIRRKLGAESTYQVVYLAARYGWVSAPEVERRKTLL